MTDFVHDEIRELIARIARLQAADDWDGDLNPSQKAALGYLARANRFSRAPSQVADYLSATRGTVSQTLKALARKGLIVESASAEDRRRISYRVTDAGQRALVDNVTTNVTPNKLSDDAAIRLAADLRALVLAVLERRGGRSFGVCKTCRHYRGSGDGAACALLKVSLSEADSTKICHEHERAA